jgi:hypothetical protein
MPDLTTPLPLAYDPALLEEAVLLAMRDHAARRKFHHERDAIYLLPEERRRASFDDVHRHWFGRLGLAAPLATAIAELPVLASTCHTVVIVRAMSRKDEGADLLVAPELSGAAGRTVLIRVRPASLLDSAMLLAHLRGELLHVADMVDPAFGYQPRLALTDGGPAYEQLLRDRYRALWQVSIVGRLERRGVAPAGDRARARLDFAASFPMLGTATDALFEHFFSVWPLTHDELAAFAADPRAATLGSTLVAGGRCPLCRFPTYAPEPNPDELGPTVITLAVRDFPDWVPAHGLCRQCADLYRARAASGQHGSGELLTDVIPTAMAP